MNSSALILASIVVLAPTLSFADVDGPTKPGARASYQPSKTTQATTPTWHPSWQKPALWAQARAATATSSQPATTAVSWRDTGVKAVLWRAPQSERSQVRPALACAKECPCQGHVSCAAACGCGKG